MSPLDRIVGLGSDKELDLRDPSKLQLTLFVKNAWLFHVCIINWPVGVPFIKCGIKTANGFKPGYERLHDFTAVELAAICGNRIKALIAEAEGKVIKKPELCVEMVSWDEGKCSCICIILLLSNVWSVFIDEINLPFEEQGDLPVEQDTERTIIIAVSHSPDYHEKMEVSSLWANRPHPQSLPAVPQAPPHSPPSPKRSADISPATSPTKRAKSIVPPASACAQPRTFSPVRASTPGPSRAQPRKVSPVRAATPGQS